MADGAQAGQRTDVDGDERDELQAARDEVLGALAEKLGGSDGSIDWATFTAVQSAKGGDRDPTVALSLKAANKLEWQQRETLFRHNWLARVFVKRFAREVTRSWLTLRVEQDPEHPLARAAQAEADKRKVNLRSHFRKMIEHDLNHGDGLGALGVTEEGAPPLSAELELNNVQSLDYVNVFTREDVFGAQQDNNPYSETHKHLVGLTLFPVEKEGQPRDVHVSRFMHIQSEEDPNDPPWGFSAHERLWPIYRLVDVTRSSVELLMYRLVLLVYTSDEFYQAMKSSDPAEVRAARDKIQSDLSYLNVWLKNSEEELETLSMAGSLGNITPLLDWVRDLTAGSMEMGRHIIFGSAAGELSSSAEDTLRFHDVAHGYQEDVLRGPVEWAYEVILASLINTDPEFSDLDLDELEWSVEFDPIRPMSEPEKAEVESNRATAVARRTSAINEAFELAGIGRAEYLSVMENIWGEALSAGTVEGGVQEILDRVPEDVQPEVLDELLTGIASRLGDDPREYVRRWLARHREVEGDEEG